MLAGVALTAPPVQASDHPPRPRVGSAVLDWNDAATRAAAAACIAPNDNPLNESRMYAMAQLAVHDALNAIDRRYDSYGPAFTARRNANPKAAVAAAAQDTLVSAISEIQAPVPQSCRDAGIASVEEFYAAQLQQVPDGRAKRRGLAAGHRAADGIIALRRGDGADTPLVVANFPQGSRRESGASPRTFRLRSHRAGGRSKPFGLTDADQFSAPGPLPLSSARYARDVNEVKALGGDGVTTPTRRSADQTEIALFWLESSPTMWNRVARQLARSHRLDGWQQARMLGQLNIALADGYIATFTKKYRELFWRPVTAIRAADRDGNSRTSADPTWTPLRTTPPIPDHDSGHAVEGGAAAGALRAFFGTDRLRFAVCSDSLARSALRLRRSEAPPVPQRDPGRLGERRLADLRGFPLPLRHPGRHPARPRHRDLGGQSHAGHPAPLNCHIAGSPPAPLVAVPQPLVRLRDGCGRCPERTGQAEYHWPEPAISGHTEHMLQLAGHLAAVRRAAHRGRPGADRGRRRRRPGPRGPRPRRRPPAGRDAVLDPWTDDDPAVLPANNARYYAQCPRALHPGELRPSVRGEGQGRSRRGARACTRATSR